MRSNVTVSAASVTVPVTSLTTSRGLATRASALLNVTQPSSFGARTLPPTRISASARPPMRVEGVMSSARGDRAPTSRPGRGIAAKSCAAAHHEPVVAAPPIPRLHRQTTVLQTHTRGDLLIEWIPPSARSIDRAWPYPARGRGRSDRFRARRWRPPGRSARRASAVHEGRCHGRCHRPQSRGQGRRTTGRRHSLAEERREAVGDYVPRHAGRCLEACAPEAAAADSTVSTPASRLARNPDAGHALFRAQRDAAVGDLKCAGHDGPRQRAVRGDAQLHRSSG